jgi:hypothetical protein
VKELTLDELKKLLRFGVKVTRNKNMISIRMDKKEYEKIKEHIPAEADINNGEAFIKTTIEN